MKQVALLSWSGGKDSALSLRRIQENREYEVAGLITTVTSEDGRVSMHGLRRDLLDMQAESLGLPLEEVLIHKNAGNIEYETCLVELLARYKGASVNSVIYGDIFLEDIKAYREEQLGKVGVECVFPLWKENTIRLAREFIDSGFRAVTICVDSEALDGSFTGREFGYDFLSDLPTGIDPCGENGEFHTFIYDGPIFRNRIDFEKAEVSLRDGRFYCCDLLPL